MDKVVNLARGLGTRMRKTDESAKLSEDQAKVADTGSIDAILAAEPQARTLYDKAWEDLDSLRQKKEGKKAKPTITIKPSGMVSKPYLETTDDVTAFVDAIKQRLDNEIADGKRVQIR